LAAKFKDMVDAENREGIEFTVGDDESLFHGFGIFWTVSNHAEIIRSTIDKAVESFFRFEAKAEKAAIASMDKENLITYFSFPDEIKVACKQYLVYFAQFLADLGIQAEAEIKEQTGQTLFKVIPSNQNEALDKIRAALTVYLNAPTFPDSEFLSNSNSDVAAVQWQANVMHLKSQLMLAKSAIQMKDATIEILTLSNYQYQQLALHNGLKENLKNEEDVVSGILTVKKYEGKGFTLNLPEILRRLKRGLGRRKE